MRKIIILLTILLVAVSLNGGQYIQAKELDIEALIQQLGDEDTWKEASDILRS